MRRLLLLVLLTPSLALAEEGPPATPDALPRFGVAASVGVPDGVVASALFRPIDMLRLSAGGTWNYFGFGLQAGVGLKPLQWPIAPTIDLEAGHYFDADMSWLADRNAGVPTELRPLLKKVGYNYANLQVGIEVGSSRSLVLFARAGISYLWTTIRGVSEVTDTGTGQPVTVRIQDPLLRGTIPSLKLGLIFFL
jgi:hypothetical protein